MWRSEGILWVLGVELWLSALAGNTFTHRPGGDLNCGSWASIWKPWKAWQQEKVFEHATSWIPGVFESTYPCCILRLHCSPGSALCCRCLHTVQCWSMGAWNALTQVVDFHVVMGCSTVNMHTPFSVPVEMQWFNYRKQGLLIFPYHHSTATNKLVHLRRALPGYLILKFSLWDTRAISSLNVSPWDKDRTPNIF